MPDIHAGAGCTVRTTMTIKDKVVPNLVGVDIGCGMETAKIKESNLDMERLDNVIRENIPAGFEIRYNAHRYFDRVDLSALRCADKVDLERAKKASGHWAAATTSSKLTGMNKGDSTS